MQRSAFQSLHRQALDLYHLRLCSQPRVCVGTMTLINRSFFRFTCRFSARPARDGARPRRMIPPANPPPKIAMASSAAGLFEPTSAGSCPCRNPGLLDACRDLPHFGYVRNTSTIAPPWRRPVIDVGSAMTRGRRQSFLHPRLPHEKPIFRCESAPVAPWSNSKSLSPLPKYHSHPHQDTVR